MVQAIVENILPEYRKKKPEFVAMVNADILKKRFMLQFTRKR